MVERKRATDGEAGFLGRWSRRKVEARHGVPPAEPLPPQPAQQLDAPSGDGGPAGVPAEKAEAPRLPTLADVQALTAESDFAPFMARGVATGVRNAAMKKLFADPHYNVMDGLDIYIDDYTKTTPLTLAILKKMNGAKALGLFDEPEQDEAATTVGPDDADAPAQLMREDADEPGERRVAQSGDQPEAPDQADPPAPPVPDPNA